LSHPVDIVRYGATEYDHPIQPASGSEEHGTEISFTTGPRGVETHWRQVVFLLREPVQVKAGERMDRSGDV
jgi:protein arginine N-methyltransferase 3